MRRSFFSSISVTEIFFFLFLLAMPIGKRIFIYGSSPTFSEYESIFFYGSDFLLILLLSLIAWKSRFQFSSSRSYWGNSILIPIIIFVCCSGISLFFTPFKILVLYHFARLALLIITACAIPLVVANKNIFRKVIACFAILAVLESLLGIAQFTRQESLGLTFLGESRVDATTLGAAKVVVGGARVLRAYGTFPHPNVFAAYLLIGFVAFIFLSFSPPSRRYLMGQSWKEWRSQFPHEEKYGALFMRYLPTLLRSIVVASGLFIVLAGLIVSFSRGAWVIGVLLALPPIFYGLFKSRREALKLFFTLFASIFLLIGIFTPFIIPRANIDSDEPAVTLRATYNRLGFDLIKQNPLGVGIGNQVRFAREEGMYQKFGMTELWQWQPIHNIYILIASEIGIVGLLAFLAFVFLLVFYAVMQKPRTYEMAFALGILLISLLFGLIDHFSWTLWQGELMLWFAIGLILSQRKL